MLISADILTQNVILPLSLSHLTAGLIITFRPCLLLLTFTEKRIFELWTGIECFDLGEIIGLHHPQQPTDLITYVISTLYFTTDF